TAYRGNGHHHITLGQRDTNRLRHPEKIKDHLLAGMVRTGGVSRRRPDTLVLHLEHLLCCELFISSIAPVPHPYLAVEPFGCRLGEAVSEYPQHNSTIVVSRKICRQRIN